MDIEKEQNSTGQIIQCNVYHCKQITRIRSQISNPGHIPNSVAYYMRKGFSGCRRLVYYKQVYYMKS